MIDLNDLATINQWKASWRMQGNAVQGRSHVAKEIPCQDKVCCFQSGEACVIALADGAGSAAHSDVGAELTTKTVCKYLAENFDGIVTTTNAAEAKFSIHSIVFSALKEKAEEKQWELSSLASTMLFVAVKGEDCLIGHIGDGVICCSKENALKAISLPSNGEFSNSTTFVTSPNALLDFRLYKAKVGSIKAFCLMSDGAAESLFNRRTREVASMVGKVFVATVNLKPASYAEYYERLLHDLLKMRTSDDCSIVVMAKANTASTLLDMDEFAFLRQCGLRKGKSSRAMRSLLTVLSTAPQTKSALKRKLHVREKAVSRRLDILMEQDIVLCSNGKYYTR